MDQIENQLKLLLQGKAFTENIDFCDFTIEDQIKFDKEVGRKYSSRTASRSSKSRSRSPKAKIVSTPEGPRPTLHDPKDSRAKALTPTVKKIHRPLPITRQTATEFSDTDDEGTNAVVLGLEQEDASRGSGGNVVPKERSVAKDSYPGASSATASSSDKPSCKRFPDLLSPAHYGRSVAVENLDHRSLVDVTDAQVGKPKYIPKVNMTVNYIVAALFINEHQELLMVEEANPSRRGQWGIPAGNVNHGETLTTAFMRVMKQETGLLTQPTTLLFVEQRADAWFRFVMTGNIIGGNLKKGADTITLQAKWYKSTEGLKLRGKDEYKEIVKLGKEYYSPSPSKWHLNLLPFKNSHDRLYARIIYCLTKSPNDLVRILLMRSEPYHFPVVEIHPDRDLKDIFNNFFQKLFGTDIPVRRTHGVLCVEHSPNTSGNDSDGICITLLCSCLKPSGHLSHANDFLWLEVSQKLGEELVTRTSPNACVKFRVIIRE